MSATTFTRFSKFILWDCPLNRYGLVRKHFIRCRSNQTGQKVLECLKNKSILRVSGTEAVEFLQGLVTNDMKHFDNGAANIYSLFLNTKGRVLFDTIIYKNHEKGLFYIECDSQVAQSLQNHLKIYRVRRKIDIDILDHQMKVWSMFDLSQCLETFDKPCTETAHKFDGIIFPCGTLSNTTSKMIDNIIIYEDPRLSDLGLRILTESKIERNDILKHTNSDEFEEKSEYNYRQFRYKLGIGEGSADLPPGKAFPLEINCDYLHGVSFHKGCYIGQELTARTHHTGVVRKRLMPLIFDEVPKKSLEYDEKILNESGKVVGKFRGSEQKYGLGLMRISETLNSESVNISGVPVKVIKPVWWPQESKQIESVSADSNK